MSSYLSFSFQHNTPGEVVSNFDYNEACTPYSILLDPGKYFFEAWGAAGGSNGGKGGYTAGTIEFHSQTQLYAIVGGIGEGPVREFRTTAGGCGGGGNGGAPYNGSFSSGAGGGGATTIYYQTQSISNRILVSGGGGAFQGPGITEITGHACGLTAGYAGGLEAGKGTSMYDANSDGATQSFGKLDGKGSDGRSSTSSNFCMGEGSGGSGGGYLGGTSAISSYNSAGSGGSSYISGHPECSTFENIAFSNPKILAGNEEMSLPNGTKSIGNPNHGYLRITYILPLCSCPKLCFDLQYFMTFASLILDS